MRKMEEVFLLGLMTQALRELSKDELDHKDCRRFAYWQTKNCVAEALASHEYPYLDAAAHCAESYRRKYMTKQGEA